ncbi:folylpolyglutamate synthase/dihydrofolate synthase family protein [Bacteroides helcogenes]|uniref:Dihydrofolate synthase/folylpolyglutamate synthase n=1 Tax=Bacteroides helcogenes (strain ATCC 35417 / DSM 20613 / JCM 6297 / CCUG 15421 / P 36-108) TaxID=693979 RepID=E6SPN2_BACT6|nr:folylpolyglutamate synthase/dihydrofolate synthase family protein [Bacteroides helcogenes]ADV43873.1 FolC bifunctional protein [Bacteroides helcogenes P 36-108]MDY5237501.1 folylpolyglutamate synthase/dihydrofolate synthase family protein [Bacteroides helcogenes]
MDYQDTLTYLYNSAPMFQQVGSSAYKEGLENTLALDEHFGHPHRSFRSIHVAGTNGKGSCSHTLAAILQEAGYRVGLYTSPHLIDFRERIRVNGRPIPEEYVIHFVEKERNFFEPLHPSFFELTTAMAFRYFADEKVDVAVIEVGLGGRLDCTNIIHPDLCLITNISFDHTQFLGDTLAKIAEEKAGIIKKDIPVVIGETIPETKPVFLKKALETGAPVYFAEENDREDYPGIECELEGIYQKKNTRTILTVLPLLQEAGFRLDEQSVRSGFAHVTELTGLMGRWQKLQDAPTLICDTGHNVGGITYIVKQLKQQTYRRLHIVIGMVNDKDIRGVLALLPQEATYYFTKASVKRALPESELKELASTAGLQGSCYPDVPSAVRAAQKKSLPEDFIFVGGSNFIVADLLANRNALNLH